MGTPFPGVPTGNEHWSLTYCSSRNVSESATPATSTSHAFLGRQPAVSLCPVLRAYAGIDGGGVSTFLPFLPFP